MTDEEIYAAILQALQEKSMDFGNYNANKSVMNYNASQNFNANAGNFSQQMQQAGWANTKKVSEYPSNFQMRCVYTPVGAGAHPPIDIALFQSSYLQANGGTFLANGDLQFTNVAGDLVTISMIGRNAPTVEDFYNILETEPMNLGWTRMFVRDEAQKDYGMVFSDRNQFGSKTENDLSPNIYDNQYTYRPLIQDVPLNFRTSKKRGILWQVGNTETGPGTRMVFFVDNIISPDSALDNKAMLQNLGTGTEFQAPMQPLLNGGGGMGATNPQTAQIMQNFLQAKANLIKR